MNAHVGGRQFGGSIRQLGMRLFGASGDNREAVQRIVGIFGGGGSLLIGVVNTVIYGSVYGTSLVESFNSQLTGLVFILGFATIACGFWDHPLARWTHVAVFVFSGILGALTANRGNITSSFFIVFAILLLVEYRVNHVTALTVAPLMLIGYVAALSVGYQDDVPRPVLSALASLITVLTFVAILAGVVLRHRMQFKRDAEELERRVAERTADLDVALRERTVMLQEIHHRVKNNMQTVSTLLGMEADRIDDGKAREVLAASQQRIQAMSGVHDIIYRSERLDEVELAPYARDLIAMLLHLAISPVDLEVDVEEAGTVDVALAVSLGLVLNELVSNTLKHAFDADTVGRVRIRLSSGEGNVHLEVEDDGRGLPDGFSIERDSGTGLSLVSSVVRYRGGSITVTSDAGTCWVLDLPRTTQARLDA